MEIRAKKLKEFLSLVTKLGDEPSLKLNADGLSTVVVDPAHVSIIQATLPKSEDCNPAGEEHEFTVDGKKMLKYVSGFKPNDMLTVKIEDGRMTIHGGDLKFKMALLDPMTWPKVPNLGSKLTAGGTFQVSDLKAVIGSKLGAVTIESNGTLTAQAISETDSIEVKGEKKNDEQAKAVYPEEYIANALFGESVEVKFSTDLPCIIVPQLENLNVSILVAPRIESD